MVSARNETISRKTDLFWRLIFKPIAIFATYWLYSFTTVVFERENQRMTWFWEELIKAQEKSFKKNKWRSLDAYMIKMALTNIAMFATIDQAYEVRGRAILREFYKEVKKRRLKI